MNKPLAGSRSQRRLSRTALVLALSFFLLPPLASRPAGARAAKPSEAAAPAGFVRAATIGEILSRWRPETHLYVLGDVGLNDGTLQELAAWLADKHWTVLLVQNAAGQTYTDVDGHLRTDDYAIEYATGQGIPRQRGFSAQVQPRTKERDGAIFTIVLAPHALFYTGSEAQDSRGFGEAQFKDNLDRWAIVNMRAGGNIIGAVKDTITNISSLVEGAIDHEKEEAERNIGAVRVLADHLERRSRELGEISPGGFRRLQLPDAAGLRARIASAQGALDEGKVRQALEITTPIAAQAASIFEAIDTLQRSIDDARRELNGAATALNGLEESAARLRESDPKLTGALARPDVQRLQQELAGAERSLADDPARARQTALALERGALAQVKAIADYPVIGQKLTVAETRLGHLEGREHAAAARRSLLAARQGLAEARELYGQGTPGYAERLETGKRALAAAERKISDAETMAALKRAAIRFLLILLAAALLAAAFALNRRRRGVKLEAEKLLAGWRAALDRKLEILLDELEQRVARFIGPASGEGQRPHTGETLRLAGEIRADVGSLYILWTSAGSVLQQAEALIRARRLGAVYNFFLPGKYRRGIALLKDEPVPFDPEGGLPRIFGNERTWRDDLLGDLASYQPFRKTFQEIVAELNLRAGRAVAALDLVESSVTQSPTQMDATAEIIRRTESHQEEIDRAGAADGLFLAPALFAAALPAAAAALTRARALFPNDPVGAVQGDAGTARSIATDASRLAEILVASRNGVLPAAEAGAAALRQAQIGTGWIETGRAGLSDRANLLAGQAAEHSVSAAIEELDRDLADLGSRVARAVALSKTLDGTARPETRRVTEIVRTAREELGGALALAADRMLCEDGADPSARLEGSARQTDAAQAALGTGELDAADAALAEAARLTAEAAAIVEATRQAFAAQQATVVERRAETCRIEGLLPDHEGILAGIRAAFAPSVLALRSGDPEHPEANATLADNLDEVRTHVGFAHEKLDRAVAVFGEGKLLAAAALLREVKRHQELAVHRLAEIAERQSRLERTVISNRDLLATLEDRVREDRTAVAGDPRCMQPTVAAFEQGSVRVRQGRQAVEAAPGDPFVAEEELLAAKAILDDVHDRLAPKDRLLFAEAQKSVEGAARQLATATGLAGRAAGDGIPDSAEIAQALGSLRSLTASQDQAKASLQIEHADWNALDAEADRIASEAAHCAATLTGELAAGKQAADAVSNASRIVRDAASWSGSYGVTIGGDPGADDLSRARDLLQQGRYREAEQHATSAQDAAAQAIASAEATVRRLWEEEERRSREQWSSSSSSSSSSGDSSGSSGSSWGSSDSGSSSSSWGESSSGAGRSSW